MSSRRTLILIGAIVMGALAALMIFNYVGSIEDEAKGDSQRVSVVVVTGPIDAGTKADVAIGDGRIALGDRPAKDLPANAVTQLADIKGRIAAISLAAGEVLTSNKFVNSNDATNSKSTVLDKGQVAVTVSIDQIRSVAGLVQPGDYVNMMVGVKEQYDATGAVIPGTDKVAGVEYLYQKVRVLAVGKSFGTPVAASTGPAVPGEAAPTTTAPAASDLMTFALPPDAAQVVVAAADAGSLRLALVRPDYEPMDIPQYRPSGTFPGALGLTPYPASSDDPTSSGSGK